MNHRERGLVVLVAADHAVATALLGEVHAPVGPIDQRLPVFGAVTAAFGNADARSDRCAVRTRPESERAQARNGSYSQFEVQRGLPIGDLIARFEQEGEDWRIKPMLKARTNFMVHNLLDPPPAGRFDIILCRNVLLYFSAERRRAVLDRLASAIQPDGMLILGAGETVLGQTDAFVPDKELRGIYRPKGSAASA